MELSYDSYFWDWSVFFILIPHRSRLNLPHSLSTHSYEKRPFFPTLQNFCKHDRVVYSHQTSQTHLLLQVIPFRKCIFRTIRHYIPCSRKLGWFCINGLRLCIWYNFLQDSSWEKRFYFSLAPLTFVHFLKNHPRIKQMHMMSPKCHLPWICHTPKNS